MTYVSRLEQFPTDLSWGILTLQHVHIPGDERSRTAPGHGYPERTEYFPNLQVFANEQDWLEAIKQLETSKYRTNYRAFIIEPKVIEITTKVAAT